MSVEEDQTSDTRGHRNARAATTRSHMMTPVPSPLILKFQTCKGRYAYDAYTDAILKLDPVCFALLDFIEHGPRCTVPSAIADKYPPQEVAESRSRLELLFNKSAVFRPVSINSRLASPEFVARHLKRIAGTFNHLILEVTQNCNLRCRYCVFSGRHAGMRHHNDLTMTWDVARKAIDFFLANPVHQAPSQHISFYGGEPTLNMGLVRQCVEYARSRVPNITFGLTTNGTLLTEQVTSFLTAYDFTLYVSLDGPSAIHDRARTFRGGGGTFDVISRNLNALKTFAPEYYAKRVVIQCTMSPGVDVFTLLDFFAGASDLIGGTTPIIGLEVGQTGDGLSAAQLAEFKSNFTALEERYLQKVVRADRGDTEFAILRGIFEKPYLFIHRRIQHPNGRGEDFHTWGTCVPANYRLLVRADGTFLPCVKCNDTLDIGNVEKGLDWAKICEIYRAYHDLHQHECRTCWAMNLCTSCIALDTQRTGNFEASLYQPRCEDERRYWKEKLTTYASVLEQNPTAFDHLYEVTILHSRVPLLDDLSDMAHVPEAPCCPPPA
jgi:uncharacterized protein